MGKAKQVMDIKVSKGIAQSSNEELRRWTEKGWEQAMKEGNYDRSRTHLNFETHKGGIVTAVDKNYPLQNRMAEKLAERGIKDDNDEVNKPHFRTVVNFIFGGSTDRMREMAFGEQKVDFVSKDVDGQIKRMPDIEQWAKDIYDFVADK